MNEQRLFIITGTSRGIGGQAAKMLLEKGNVVYGIARGEANGLEHYPNYNHIHYDLSNILQIEGMLKGIFDRIDESDAEMICLMNNAAMLEPLKTIDQCSAEEINIHLQISLAAPMILTSSFIKLTDNMPVRRKIINISSGSGTNPAPAMSVYSAAKAGLNMFTGCVGLEQLSRNNPLEIIAVDPGMVETEMQATARGKNAEDFEMAAYFRQAYRAGQLQSPEELGNHLLKLIEKKVEPGKMVKYFET